MKVVRFSTMGVLGILGLLVLAGAGEARATSWPWNNKGTGTVVNGAMVSSGSSNSYADGFSAMNIKNPGGWGAPTKPEDMTAESLRLLTAQMKADNQTIKEMLAPPAPPQGIALTGGGGADNANNALVRQQIANTIKPLTPQTLQKPKPVTGGYVAPKIPVEEWNAISQGQQNNAASTQR